VKRRGEELLAQVRAAEVPDPRPRLRAGAARSGEGRLVKKLAAISQAWPRS